MRIPRYWAKGEYTLQGERGKTSTFSCWRWSDTSAEQAQQLANDKARDIALTFQNRQELNRYEYGRNPLREEVVRSIKNESGSEIGVVTRNLYGALVLNAVSAMFIDIDFPDKGESASLSGAVSKLLGSKTTTTEQVYVQNIEQWSQRNPQWGLRVYRTFGGLRCLITNEVFDPRQARSLDILSELGSDALYVRLCQAQESFRARLTPKPWRCGATTPPSRFPWENTRQEQNYREWERRYQRAASNYTVCRLVKQLGADEMHPDVAPILAAHDEMACAAGSLSLA